MKKYFLLVSVMMLLLGMLLTGCEQDKKGDQIVWKEYATEYYSLKYPAGWNIFNEDECASFSNVFFTPKEVAKTTEEILEVFFGVTFVIEKGPEFPEEDFYAEMLIKVEERERDPESKVISHGKTIIDGKPAYRIESQIIPDPAIESSFEAKLVEISLYNIYNIAELYFLAKTDQYDTNIGIANEMFKSFKW
ncbi:MAG: hypothetical protein MI740_15305 [Halanaerobiales bacterium]|nr:hypothetical protein [Halanaerobiales bacterium]